MRCRSSCRREASADAPTREPTPERETLAEALDPRQVVEALERRPRWADLASDESDNEEGDGVPAASIFTHKTCSGSASSSSTAAPAPAAAISSSGSGEKKWADYTDSSDEDEAVRAPQRPRMATTTTLSAAAPEWTPSSQPVSKERRGHQEQSKRRDNAWKEQPRQVAGKQQQQSWKSSKKGKAASSSSSWNNATAWNNSGAAWNNAAAWNNNASWNNSWTNSWSSSYYQKRQCQFTIGIEEEPSYRVCRKLLGSGGEHVKRFAQTTGAKLRLRGRGSKFLEGPEQQESSDPLMLCISAPDEAGYAEVVRMVTEHLENIYADYQRYCQKVGLPSNLISVQFHEGAREGAR